ncbi:flavin monoamine oxidase family protein [Lysobacter cavernae]|uniref:Tryptophan 2-monooxygenase n=1 Tax=Lysobacter cavernae TaxID=1685901 RepID=A0ABV7RR90_9GAMM
MAQLLRLARLAERCERTGENAQEAIGQESLHDGGRRRLMQGAVAGVATVAAGMMAPPAWAAAAKLTRTAYARMTKTRGVAVVGAGLAGLACAAELARNGVAAKVYEAGGRVGGRCWSLRGFFPGQVAERGAEFIGASHHTMLGYARALDLPLEEFSRYPGKPYYHFEGRVYTEAQVVEEFRAFAACIREDLSALSYPTADRYTEADSLFDFMSLDDYLLLYGAGGLLRGIIGAAYAAEFGAGLDELSAISFLRFVYGDRRSKFGSYGAHGSDHFHVVDGNDRIATGLAERLPTPVQLGHRLIAAHKLASGRVRLSFDLGGRSVQADHDAVVLALPFSVLRDVHLDASLELPPWKQLAIGNAAMGDNSKTMVGFKQPYWYVRHESNGSGCSDLKHLQNTWETNPINGSDGRAVLTHQSGGALARLLLPTTVQADASAFLGDLERVLPGANETVRRNEHGQVLAFTQNWSLNPLSKGSYSCPRPGYFTTVAHNEAKPVDNVLFAGEHTSSFYEWQGFMEGAALSGLRAANEACNLMWGR